MCVMLFLVGKPRIYRKVIRAIPHNTSKYYHHHDLTVYHC